MNFPAVMAPATRVLVVDDDPSVGRGVGRNLRQAGYQVVVARSCRVALEQAQVFELAVLDLELQDGSGVDLAQELTSRGRVGALVFFSATTDSALRASAARIGPVVTKGAGLRELEQAVALVLEGPVSRLRGRANAPASASRG